MSACCTLRNRDDINLSSVLGFLNKVARLIFAVWAFQPIEMEQPLQELARLPLLRLP